MAEASGMDSETTTTTTRRQQLADIKGTAITIRPEWVDCKGITRIFSIGKSTLYRLEAEGKIIGVSLRERGKLRGKKLFSCDSVAAVIEKMAKGGEEQA
jgi:hypothetical protein